MMNQQQGFSLVEVLVSLLLVIALAFSLIQQQMQCRQLVRQLVLRAQDRHFMEHAEEAPARFFRLYKKYPS